MADKRAYEYAEPTAEELEMLKLFCDAETVGTRALSANKLQLKSDSVTDKSEINTRIDNLKTSDLTNDSGFTSDAGIKSTDITAANADKVLAVNSDGSAVEMVPLDTVIGTLNTESLAGDASISIPELKKYYELGTLPAGVSSLSVTVPMARNGYLTESAFEFGVSDDTMTALNVKIGAATAKLSGNFNKFEPGKTYQVTIVNKCAAIGAFEG